MFYVKLSFNTQCVKCINHVSFSHRSFGAVSRWVSRKTQTNGGMQAYVLKYITRQNIY